MSNPSLEEQDNVTATAVFEVGGKQYTVPGLPYSDGIDGYWWTDGNAGCDCNRSHWINEEYGDEFPDSDDCGQTIKLVSLTPERRT